MRNFDEHKHMRKSVFEKKKTERSNNLHSSQKLLHDIKQNLGKRTSMKSRRNKELKISLPDI